MVKKKQPKKIGYVGLTSGAISGGNAGTSQPKTYPNPPTRIGGKKKK